MKNLSYSRIKLFISGGLLFLILMVANCALLQASQVQAATRLQKALPAVDGAINTMVATDDYLFVGGEFAEITGSDGEWYSIAEFAKIDRQTHQVDTSCDLNVASVPELLSVHALATDGESVYVGGSFTEVDGQEGRRALFKIDAHTCQIDNTFDPQFTYFLEYEEPTPRVSSIVLDGDSLYVGGRFLHVGGHGVENLVKLSATTGAVDTNFSVNVSGLDASVYALQIVNDYLFIGGSFSQLESGEDYMIVTDFARLDKSTGSFENSCNMHLSMINQAPQTVFALESDGTSLYVGGSFSDVQLDADRASLFKINANNCEIDTAFNPLLKGAEEDEAVVKDLFLLEDKLYVGGDIYEMAGQYVDNFARLDASTGLLDRTFNHRANGEVSSIVVSGTDIYIGGSFAYVNNILRLGIARIEKVVDRVLTAAILQDDLPEVDGPIYATATTNDYLFIGGAFSTIESGGELVEIAEFAKIDRKTHQVDTSCDLNVASVPELLSVHALATDGESVYVGGSFSRVSEDFDRRALFKIDAETCQIDTSFNPLFSYSEEDDYPPVVYSLALDGESLFVGGRFWHVGGHDVSHIVKLSADTGAVDASFLTQIAGDQPAVYALEVVSNYLFIGGSIWEVSDSMENSAEVTDLVRVDKITGSFANSCDMQLARYYGGSYTVYSLASEGNSLYVGGSFPAVAENGDRAYLFKMNADSCALDAAFNPGVRFLGGDESDEAGVRSLFLSEDKLYVGGRFDEIAGQYSQNFARVDKTTGFPDMNFAVETDNVVHTIKIAGRDLYIGGYFTQVLNQARRYWAHFTVPSASEEGTASKQPSLPTPDKNSPQRNFTIYYQGKEYKKEFKALNLKNLEITTNTTHPQFCFTKGYDAQGLSHYSIKVDGENYLDHIPAKEPSLGGEVSKDGSAILLENSQHWFRYESYNNPQNEQQVCVYGKGDKYHLENGFHTWEAFAHDDSGNSTGVGSQEFLLGANSGSYHPGKIWFPLMMLQAGNKTNLLSFASFNNRLYTSQDTIKINTTTPTFYGIAVVGAQINLRVEQETSSETGDTTRATVTEQSTNTNVLSQWGINLTEPLTKGTYLITIIAKDTSDNRAVIKDVPLQVM